MAHRQKRDSPTGVAVRPLREDDTDEVIELLCATLGWENDARHGELYRWKHRQNPFGPSSEWVAEDEQGVVGFRAFMRWEFRLAGQVIRAVRAVDTATHPRAQGRGIFRALTMQAVDEMTRDGVDWIFNTPNTQSAPGYLRMGWQEIGRLPAFVRPGRVSMWPKLVSSRSPADLWSYPTTAGEDAAIVLKEITEPGERASSEERLIHTRRDMPYLFWRYGASPVGYRAVLAGQDPADGVVIFRLRRRGDLKELLIAEVIGVPASRRTRLLGRVAKACRSDYMVALGHERPRTWFPVPRGRPLLTWRGLNWAGPKPELAQWGLVAGDIELF